MDDANDTINLLKEKPLQMNFINQIFKLHEIFK